MAADGRTRASCQGCSTRREFLCDAARLAGLAAAAIGAGAVESRAWAVVLTQGTGTGDERTYPLPAADGVTIDREEQVILVRYQGEVFAFNLACPHENTALKWRSSDGRFQCPRHESKYRPDGVFMEGRATRNMDRFAVRRDGDRLVVNLARLFRSDENPADWRAAFVKA
jgi:nitrite reductase/ring-hydroxylating ferredoxin subunit